MKIIVSQKDRVLAERDFDKGSKGYPNGIMNLEHFVLVDGMDFDMMADEISDILEHLLDEDKHLSGNIDIVIKDAVVPRVCSECGERDVSTTKQKVCDFCVEK